MTSYVKEDALEVVLDEIVKIKNSEGVIEEKEPIPPHLNPQSNFFLVHSVRFIRSNTTSYA